VISIPALAILKVVAWRDRRHSTQGKDAEDLWLLLRNYLEAGQMERLYEEGMHLFDQPDFDLDRAGAWLLGKDARQVLELGENHLETLNVLCQILEPETDPDGPFCLVADMAPTRIGLGLELLAAFHAGLTGRSSP
jgi:predicted nucleotidyltransferase